jgi:hypothetical protein
MKLCFSPDLYRVGPLTPLATLFGLIMGPKYNGKFLHSKVKSLTNETRLSQALTNIVIPTFDVKYLQPTVFSSYEVQNEFLSESNKSNQNSSFNTVVKLIIKYKKKHVKSISSTSQRR